MHSIKRYGFTLLIILIFSSSTALRCFGQSGDRVTEGLCDATKIDFSDEIISLNGHWDFYWMNFLLSDELHGIKKSLKIVPSIWNDFNKEKKGIGFGTYSMILTLPENMREGALQIPQLYCSYYLYVNDSLVASNGNPGRSKAETLPEWRPQVVRFPVKKQNTIILHLSNFNHHKGGIREQILFGSPDNINDHFHKDYYSTLGLATLFIVISLCSVSLFFWKGKMETIYYALFCFCWGIRTLFTDLYAINHLFPGTDWEFLVRTEYTSFNLLMITGTLFINMLFRDFRSKVFSILMLLIVGLFCCFSIFGPPLLFTHWLNLYLVIAGVLLIYSLVLSIRALNSERAGSWLLLIGLILVVLLAGYDMIAFKGVFYNNLLIKNIGYGVIFCCTSIGLLQHLGILKTQDPSNRKLTIEDFYQKL